MKQRWGLITLVAVISFLSGGWLLQRGVASGGNVYQQALLFDRIEQGRIEVGQPRETISLMLDHAAGRGVSSLTFDSSEAMERNRERIDRIRDEWVREANAEVLDTCEFELAIAHLHVPEMA